MKRNYAFQLEKPIKRGNITRYCIMKKADSPVKAYNLAKKFLKSRERKFLTHFYDVAKKSGGWIGSKTIKYEER